MTCLPRRKASAFALEDQNVRSRYVELMWIFANPFMQARRAATNPSKGSGRSKTASIMEKTAVTPPMPTANVRIAVTAKPEDSRNLPQRNTSSRSLASDSRKDSPLHR